MKHHLATAAILIAALLFYGFGLQRGANALLIVGAAMELWFWKRAFPGFGILSRKSKAQEPR
ncbi:MAG: hypothetical protein EOP35_18695 [Rubrivivax sp.]|nr:MAG: hypothetical protein EOP35_18695 [Rubrivivax sp.]